jgi:hypothetical protein
VYGSTLAEVMELQADQHPGTFWADRGLVWSFFFVRDDEGGRQRPTGSKSHSLSQTLTTLHPCRPYHSLGGQGAYGRSSDAARGPHGRHFPVRRRGMVCEMSSFRVGCAVYPPAHLPPH